MDASDSFFASIWDVKYHADAVIVKGVLILRWLCLCTSPHFVKTQCECNSHLSLWTVPAGTGNEINTPKNDDRALSSFWGCSSDLKIKGQRISYRYKADEFPWSLQDYSIINVSELQVICWCMKCNSSAQSVPLIYEADLMRLNNLSIQLLCQCSKLNLVIRK